MEKKIEIKFTPAEIAEQLYELDNEQVAEMFGHWKRLFDEGYERVRAEGRAAWIFDLNHFMMYVVPKLDEDGLDFFRAAYGTMIYQMINDVHKKHLLELHLRN